MAFRLYILPMITVDDPFLKLEDGSPQQLNRPKYIVELGLPRYRLVDYGKEKIAIVLVADITQSQHTALVTNSDVLGFPRNLSSNLTPSQVTNVSNKYSNLGIPSGWISTNRTVADVAKITIGLFLFNQKWRNVSGQSIQEAGITLGQTFNSLSTANKAAFQQVFDQMKIDRSSLSGSNTLGEGMQEFGIQISARPFKFIVGNF